MNDPITKSLSLNFEFPLEDATIKNLHAFPQKDGGIQIELQAGGSSVEIKIGPDGQIHSVFWEKILGE